MSELSEQLGQRLRAARKAAHYKSARAFSSQYNIPETTYAQHESGKRSLNVETLIHYSRLLNISAGWLLTGHGETLQEISHSNQCQEFLAKQSLNIENLIHASNVTPSNLTTQHQLAIKEFLTEMWNGILQLIKKINQESS